ncbi:MAG: CPBP family intramembrane metalloprotease [Clostridia bacterium]|nr:CPBP family intramembrane metalloprotease [Clostridia bacterium]
MESKREIKRRVLNVSAAVLALFIVFLLSRFYTLFGAAVFPESLPVYCDAAAWALFLFAGAAVLYGAYRPPVTAEGEVGAAAPPRRKKPLYLVPVTVFLLLTLDLSVSFFGQGGNALPDLRGGELVLRAVLGCTVYPFCEETFFRGVLLSAVREKDDPPPVRLAAVLLTAAAFAFFHRDGGFLFALAAGAVLSIPAPYGAAGPARFSPPFGPIAAHAAYNLALYSAAALARAGVDPLLTVSAFAGAAAAAAGIMILAGGKNAKRRKDKKDN